MTTYHGVFEPTAIAATSNDAWVRNIVCASALDNGNIVKLKGGKSATDGESEVWTAVVPSAADGLTNLWMVYSGEEIPLAVSGDSVYKGLNLDPRNFYTLADKVVSAYKPFLGDIIKVSDAALTGSFILNTTTHVNAVDNTGGFKLLWGNSQTASVLSYKLIAVSYISLATGAINTQRQDAYVFECVGL